MEQLSSAIETGDIPSCLWTERGPRLGTYLNHWRTSTAGRSGFCITRQNVAFSGLRNDSGHADGSGVVRTSDGKVLARYKNGLSSTFAALSNDGAWLAVVAHSGRYHGNLVVLNLSTKNWSNLGPIVAHPFRGWDYIKSSWNPWFKDSSHLAFVSQGSVVVATPDGKQKKTLSKLQAPAGLAAPSPDGTQVAYVTFAKLPNEGYPSNVWSVPGASTQPCLLG